MFDSLSEDQKNNIVFSITSVLHVCNDAKKDVLKTGSPINKKARDTIQKLVELLELTYGVSREEIEDIADAVVNNHQILLKDDQKTIH